MTSAEILSEARSVADDAVQLRRRIHRHPEIGLTLDGVEIGRAHV